jgi:hypothetical protein
MKHVAKYKADKNVTVTDGLYFLFAEDIFVSASSLNLECITAELVVFSSLVILTHCGRVTKISVFNKVKLGTSASSP